MFSQCKHENGSWLPLETSSIECSCPKVNFSPMTDLALSVSIFIILAATFAFGIFVFFKTVRDATRLKSTMRRQSEIADEEAFIGFHGRSSSTGSSLIVNNTNSSQSESRRDSGSTLTRLSSNLSQRDAEDKYVTLPAQYIITPIQESDEENADCDELHDDNDDDAESDENTRVQVNGDEEHHQECEVNRKLKRGNSRANPIMANKLFLQPKERNDSVSSDYNAERLFRMMIFQDKSCLHSDLECEHQHSPILDRRGPIELVTSVVDTFNHVRNSIWSSKSQSQFYNDYDNEDGVRRRSSNLRDFTAKRRRSKKNSDPVVRSSLTNKFAQTIRKSSDDIEEVQLRKKKSRLPRNAFSALPIVSSSSTHVHSSSQNPVNGIAPEYGSDALTSFVRKESVASCHAPIGPEEGRKIQAKQKRRVAVSFHEHDLK